MKILFAVLMFLIINVSLEAYEKQVVLDKFKDRANAESALKNFKEDKLFARFDSLASGNDLKILVCSQDDNNNILVVEPIGNKYILEAVMDIVKLKFKESYSEDLTPCKVASKPAEIASKSVSVVSKPAAIASRPVKVVSKPIEVASKLVNSAKQVYISQRNVAKIIFSNFSVKNNADEELKRLQQQDIYKELDALAVKNSFIIHARPLGGYTVLIAEPIVDTAVYEEVLALLKKRYKDAYGINDCMAQKHISMQPTTEKIITPKPMPEIKKELKNVNTNMEAQKKEDTNIVARVIEKEMEVTQNTKTEVQKKEDTKVVVPIVEKVQEDAVKPKQEMEVEAPKLDAQNVETTEATNKVDVKNNQVEQESESTSSYFSWWYVFLIIVSVILFMVYRKFKPIYDTY